MDGAHWYLGVLLSVTFIVLLFETVKIQKNPITYVAWILVELFIGTISYPIYLIHQNIGFVIENRLSDLNGTWNYTIVADTVMAMLMIGACLYFVIERPIQNRIHICFVTLKK